MAQASFFPPPRYAVGEHITFLEPNHTEWTIVARISQQNSQNDESDLEAGYGPSYAVATFRVSRDLDGQQAYMRVSLQVPHQGTEFFPPNERAKQAAARGHCEVEAIRAFHKQNLTITPALLGIKEDVQDQQGVISGGYAIRFVLQRVPGYRLWEDHVMPKYRAQPHRLFTDLTLPERDQIRESFNKGYRELNKLGWVPYYPSATKLIWDPIASKLYFVDFRDVHEAGSDEDVVPDGNDKLKPKEMAPIVRWGFGASPFPLISGKNEQIFLSGRSSPGVLCCLCDDVALESLQFQCFSYVSEIVTILPPT